MQKVYIGIDPSLRSTGLCAIYPDRIETQAIVTTPDMGNRTYREIMRGASKFLSLCSDTDAEFVVGIEEYAFHMAKNRGYSGTIEAGGILKADVAYVIGVRFQMISMPSSTWKKAIFGKSTDAPKKSGKRWEANYINEMERVSGHRFDTPDEADAWCIAETLRRRDSEAES